MNKQDIFNGLSWDWKWASWDKHGMAMVHRSKPDSSSLPTEESAVDCLRMDFNSPVEPVTCVSVEIIQRDIPEPRPYIDPTDGTGLVLTEQPVCPTVTIPPKTQPMAPPPPSPVWQEPKPLEQPCTFASQGCINTPCNGVDHVFATVEARNAFYGYTKPPAGPTPDLPPFDQPVDDDPVKYAINYRLVGSRVTCQPPPLTTDQDVLMLVGAGQLAETVQHLKRNGYTLEGSLPADTHNPIGHLELFASLRKGDMNFIVTEDQAFYKRFSTATELAKHLNLMLKDERIRLFQAVLYGNWI
jgi:hypothetical protein